MRGATRLLVLLTPAVLLGCAPTAGLEVTGTPTASSEGPVALASAIDIGSSALADDIRVTGVSSSSIGGLLRPAVNLASQRSHTLALQYRWSWFDRAGAETGGSAQSWLPLLVYGRQTTTVQGLAPNPSAQSFKLHLRTQE